ncbi:MAG: N-acetyl-gamma-glutamyl-phosphate reductase [bacterium]
MAKGETAKVALIGGSGYTGLELLRLILLHPRLELGYVTSEKYAGRNVVECFPFLPSTLHLQYQKLDLEEALKSADIFLLALPNGLSLSLVPSLLKEKKTVIDLSADYRFKDPAIYERIYGKTHHDKGLATRAVYGLPEIYRTRLKASSLVANPGCYATSIILGITPALKAGLVNDEVVIIADAKSGVSGAGRKVETTYLFTECDQNVKPYNIGKHRHTPEIEQELNLIGKSRVSLLFTPQLVPLRRGILSNIYIPLSTGSSNSRSLERIWEVYREFYQEEPFTAVSPLGSIPCIKDVYLSNYCRLGLILDQRTNTLVVVSVLDNLLKGAAGQVVQNLNILLGFDERTGLPQSTPYP